MLVYPKNVNKHRNVALKHTGCPDIINRDIKIYGIESNTMLERFQIIF